MCALPDSPNGAGAAFVGFGRFLGTVPGRLLFDLDSPQKVAKQLFGSSVTREPRT